MKHKINYAIDITMLAVFIVCGATGIMKIPELDIAMTDSAFNAVSILHDWSGVAGLLLLAVHTLLHAKWLQGATRLYAGKIAAKAGVVLGLAKKASPKAFGLVFAAAAILIFAQYDAEAHSEHGRGGSEATIPVGIDYPAGSLKNGTYTGTANGYNPAITVEVDVQGGSITAVRIVSQNETRRWFNRVVDLIPNRILQAQGTKVDVVTGATASSRGIMSAVEAALKNAAK